MAQKDLGLPARASLGAGLEGALLLRMGAKMVMGQPIYLLASGPYVQVAPRRQRKSHITNALGTLVGSGDTGH